MNNLVKVAVLGSLLLSALATAAAADGDPTGKWQMDDGRLTVQVSPCGDKFCGYVVALAKPLRHGKPKVDRKNPDKALRSRPIIGLSVINNMKQVGPNRYEGTIYNADDGNTYTGGMTLDGDAIRVKGCVLFICKSMKFVRVN
jgi:uncharacterized protein (DUF2147 family)